VLVKERLKTGFRRREEVLTWRRRLVSGPGFEKMRVASDIDKPYPTKFHLHLNKFVLIPTRIWWASNLHGNSPLASNQLFILE
jgi:hypothetical protein